MAHGDVGIELATAVIAWHSHVDLFSELALVLFLRNNLVLHLEVNVVDKAGLDPANVAALTSIYHAYITHEETQVLLIQLFVFFFIFRKYG